MPKKATTARSGAQRNKAKTQKAFEIVRQNVDEQELIHTDDQEPILEEEPVEIASVEAPVPALEMSASTSRPARAARRAAARASVATQEAETEKEVATPEVAAAKELVTASTAKGSASARLAARRGQKAQQRSNATLITAEHYTYVTRDLKIIAVLASLMFIAIIVLYFTIGR
jgi:hypothetical protein